MTMTAPIGDRGEEGGSRSEFSTREFPIYLTFTPGALIEALVAFFLLQLHYRDLSGMYVCLCI